MQVQPSGATWVEISYLGQPTIPGATNDSSLAQWREGSHTRLLAGERYFGFVRLDPTRT